MQSNCDTVMSGRSFVIEKLIERGLVDSFGRCNNNAELPLEHSPSDGLNGGMPGNKTSLMERYAFVAAFENSYYPGYATEKVWEPLWQGSLPIYLGAPNIRSMLPENSFINVDDFNSIDALADYIENLIQNRTAYDFYHEWRGKRPPKKFARALEVCPSII